MNTPTPPETAWDQVAYTNGDTMYGLTGLVHHRDGCRGRRDSVTGSLGWHPQTGTAAELAASPAQCGTCWSMARVQAVEGPRPASDQERDQ